MPPAFPPNLQSLLTVNGLPAAFVIAAVLLTVSVLASKISDRFGIPALLLFLAMGMLAGSDGPGGIYFDDYALAQGVGTAALVFILFSGGLDTRWADIRPVLAPGIALSTAGVMLTALLAALAAHVLLGFSFTEGLLLGAIVSSTDAAAVLSILRAKNINLKGRLEPLLELEAGSNDPTAVFLTLGIIQLLTQPGIGLLSLSVRFLWQMALGAALGYGMGRLMAVVINRLRLDHDGLYPVLTMAMVLGSYGLAEALGGNGFLSVYVTGLVLGNQVFIHKRSLLSFHDGLAWLMQIAMFLILGLLAFPQRVLPLAGVGLLFAMALMLIARPASVFLTLLPFRIPRREKLFLSWVGLRGAVPIVLATYPLLAGVPQSERTFDIVFFVVLASVLLQGTSIRQVARWLGLEEQREPWVTLPEPGLSVEEPGADLHQFTVAAGAPADGRRIVDLGLPDGVLVVLIRRQGHARVPSGGIELHAGDELILMCEDRLATGVGAHFTAPDAGATG